MEIEIRNWEKYNPRKDLKSLTWLRLDSDIGFSESLFGLSAEARWLWIFLLSFSAKKNKSCLILDFDYISFHSSVKKDNISKHIESFLEKGLILIKTDSSRIRTDTIENVSYERTNEHNEHNGNERAYALVDSSIDVSNIECIASKKKNEFDLELLYAEYPRKEGKKIGLQRLGKIINTKEKYDSVLTAIINYSHQVKDSETRFIKQFSSFISVWEDYLQLGEKQMKDFSEQDAYDYFDRKMNDV